MLGTTLSLKMGKVPAICGFICCICGNVWQCPCVCVYYRNTAGTGDDNTMCCELKRVRPQVFVHLNCLAHPVLPRPTHC